MELLNILSDRSIRRLFRRILLCMLVFYVLAAVIMLSGHGAGGMWFCLLCMCPALMAVCYGYFTERNKIMETAVEQIREYLSGTETARIESDEEGELYRLFQEVNNLAAVLSAHAEKEGRAKTFLLCEVNSYAKSALDCL